MIAVLLAAVTIAFPKEGQLLPPVERCYVIGATDGAETNLVVCGKDVPVYRTGAWATVVDVREGTNVVSVGDCRRTFVVPKRPQGAAAKVKEPTKVYTKLPYAGDRPKPHPRGKEPQDVTVVIDAGHGGPDTGAMSPHGLEEKDANLRVATAVARALADRGFRVVMTRQDDSFPALYDRPKVAHKVQADAFVSIHHNAPGYDKDPSTTRYHAVYCWNPLGEKLAKAINARMAAACGSRVADNGVLHANFAVTRNPEIPSCLVEVDFVTSPAGEADIWNPVIRTATATAIAEGIADWATR